MFEYEESLSFLGEWGSFQKTVFILLSLSAIPNGYVGMSMIFLADIPAHRCRLAPINSSSSSSPSFSLELNHSIPLETLKGQAILSRCSRYLQIAKGSKVGFFGNATEECVDGWVFSSERYISTIVTEWSLVCRDSWKAPFTVTVFFFGVIVGSLLSGILSDRFGRRLVFFATMVIQTVFSLLQAASNSWEMFCVLYFIVGIGQIANYCCAFVLGTELLTKKARFAFAAVGIPWCYAVGYVLLPLFAYFIRSWRGLLIALSLPSLLYIPLWWFLPESPRWLLAQGRVEEAERIIIAAAKKNGVTLPEVIFKLDEVTPLKECGPVNSQRLYTWMDLIKTTNIRNLTIINICIWVVVSMTYYGLSLNTTNMDGDPYINCLVAAATEFLSYGLSWFAIRYCPRRLPLPVTLLPTGVLLLLIKLIPDDMSILTLALVMIGKTAVTGAFGYIYLYATELFPTVVRNTALGALSMSSRVGSAISPHIAHIGTYNQFLPYIVMGGVTIICGLLCLLLPETKDEELPDYIPQVKAIVRLSEILKRNTALVPKVRERENVVLSEQH